MLDSTSQPDHPPLHGLDFSPGVGSSLAATLSLPLTPSEPLRSHVDLSTPHLRWTRPPSPGPCCSMASCPVGRAIPGKFPWPLLHQQDVVLHPSCFPPSAWCWTTSEPPSLRLSPCQVDCVHFCFGSSPVSDLTEAHVGPSRLCVYELPSVWSQA